MTSETVIEINNGDCLEMMKDIPDKSVDLFICDLPYAETNCKWDVAIDMEKFWSEFRRLRASPRTACIHFCSTKFGYTLIKSWEKGFKMDMVWKKRNKTGGLQSRLRPMRNHEMVYFFYEQAPKYNRDKYHKRIQAKKEHNIEKEDITMGKTSKFCSSEKYFEPPNPASVVDNASLIALRDEEKFHKEYEANGKKGMTKTDMYSTKCIKEYRDKNGVGFEPKLPASVVEEKAERKSVKDRKGMITKSDLYPKENQTSSSFTPPNPASVVEEEEDEPVSMFESTKVFIGKRHHQTEKPQDILEFFLKYWTDEGDTVLDPTMGSGSTGVACKKLGRNFIGYELDEKIFKVAEARIEK